MRKSRLDATRAGQTSGLSSAAPLQRPPEERYSFFELDAQ